MAWFFRIIETEDGRWQCRHGRLEYDTHEWLSHAVDHLTAIAADHRPARLFLHHIDGRVQCIAEF